MLAKSAIPHGAIISEIGGESVANIAELMDKIAELADGDRTTFRYHTIEDPRNSVVRSVQMDRTWFPAKHCRRDDSTGIWPCEILPPGPEAKPKEPGNTSFTAYEDPRVNAIAPSLVMVTFDLPYTVSGVADRHYYGTGLIVDAERGLVMIDRNTVPIAMGDVTVTFAGSLQVDAKVEFVHPLHNLAVIAYDPRLIGDTPVKSAKLKMTMPNAGDRLLVVGLKSDHQLAHQESFVSSVDSITLPLSRTMRFRDSNLETIDLVNAPTDFDGVLVDDDANVVATWSSFAFQSGGEAGQINRGISAELLAELVETVRSGKPVYSLEAELIYAPLFAARKLGVDEEWLARLETHNPKSRRALSVTRIVAGTPAADKLRNGDTILAIDGQVVTTFRELEKAVQKPKVTVTVWRGKKAKDLRIETVALNGSGIDRAVSWAGALLQNPHRGMAAQRGIVPTGVYVAFFSYGSPATRYGLWAGRRIVEVDDTETPDLQSFIDVVADKGDQTSVRLKTITWNGAVEVITLKLDNQYWPAYEIRRKGDGWHRQSIG